MYVYTCVSACVPASVCLCMWELMVLWLLIEWETWQSLWENDFSTPKLRWPWFLPFISWDAYWYLQGCSRIALGLESKDLYFRLCLTVDTSLGLLIPALGKFYLPWSHKEVVRTPWKYNRMLCKLQSRMQVCYFYCWINCVLLSQTLLPWRVLIPCDNLGKPSLGVPRHH